MFESVAPHVWERLGDDAVKNPIGAFMEPDGTIDVMDGEGRYVARLFSSGESEIDSEECLNRLLKNDGKS